VKKIVLGRSNLSVHVRKEVEAASSLDELYCAMRRDFWVTTPCYSVEQEGKVLEGTRLTLQCGQDGGYEFSIRTPGTPPRLKAYERELDLLWAKFIALEEGAKPEQVLDAVLKISFFWYNLMPLSRGTAAIGLIFIHGMLLSRNLLIDCEFPENFQSDWCAILNPNPKDYLAEMKAWMVPALKQTTMLSEVPEVALELSTVRKALSFFRATEFVNK
jgi:hypothetical protein